MRSALRRLCAKLVKPVTPRQAGVVPVNATLPAATHPSIRASYSTIIRSSGAICFPKEGAPSANALFQAAACHALLQGVPLMALFSTSTATTERIPLFVRQAADADVSPVFAEENDFVGQLKKLAKAELQIDAPPTAIILRKVEAGGALGEPLKSKDTVGKAGLKSEDELVVEVSAAASDAPIVMVRRSLKGPQEKLPVDQYTMRNIAINGESLVQIKLGKKGVEERRSIISAEEAIAASKVPGKFLLLQSPFA